jgi:hypothetical protein
MGAMLSILAYALLPAVPDTPPSGTPGYPEAQILDALTTRSLLKKPVSDHEASF